ncbi:MAG: cytochrome b N-terminal domain-containing protein [Gemmatimonadetes bacterium]|nr:cytochrome b N-terminal domain-containing protein [Gemmatimonadota bacterium]
MAANPHAEAPVAGVAGEAQASQSRLWTWLDERFEIGDSLKRALRKPVGRHARQWSYCLGGITFFAFLVQVVTGILLAFYYKPTPEHAYESVLFIMNRVPFGWLIRSLHVWAANLMIVAIIGHTIRVFVTGSYKPPRELNWVVGMALFALTLGFGFTGYLLPWDQRAYWATVVGTESGKSVPLVGSAILQLLRSGAEVTDLTLTRFYAIHVLLLPAIVVVLLVLHFVMIRRQGISGPL